MSLERLTMGIGDRFGLEGAAQLRAFQKAREQGVELVPVWNKSNREHTLIGTTPADTRAAADAAVRTAGWTGPYYLDADHIGLKTVDRFIPHCDFFTLDVADAIGRSPTDDDAAAVSDSLASLIGRAFPALGQVQPLDAAALAGFVARYAAAVCEATRTYRHISAARKAPFVVEVSTDEAETPQSPLELFLILGALAGQGVPAQTIAPKFSGRFNKGVDYVGDVDAFAVEFERDLTAIRYAVGEFGLSESLKISVHSGSDKFSLYGPMGRLIRKHHAGLHLKTAGTTWLEELIGLALAGGEGLAVAGEIYAQAVARADELSAPYATVIDIDRSRLPRPAEVAKWTGEAFAAALRHERREPRFNPHLRQLMHVAFKIAAEFGARYRDAVQAAAPTVSRCVAENLYERHIRPLFLA